MTTQQAMAFYHEDGLIPSWNFAMKYAGDEGHIATLPEIVEARLSSDRDDFPWSAYFTTNSAEYYGVGADGREKLIVAHGVGPMSTLEDIKKAYSWEYKDKSCVKNGGRISAKEFLTLESGHYGNVSVIDVRDYIEDWDEAFYGFRSAHQGRLDAVLNARLGHRAADYLRQHDDIARRWHAERNVKIPEGGRPYIVHNSAALNCPYTAPLELNGHTDWSKSVPRTLESGLAIGHLLHTSGLIHMYSGGWQGLVNEVNCHEWQNGARFVGVPTKSSCDQGILVSPQPYEVLRRRWSQLMRPNVDEAYTPPRLFRIEQADDEWFTRYPKPDNKAVMDDSDVEFHVRSVKKVGEPKKFTTDGMFFLRYKLSQVAAIAPKEANAYHIINHSPIDGHGISTITVQFYAADVDTSARLPRVKDIKQDYDVLMG